MKLNWKKKDSDLLGTCTEKEGKYGYMKLWILILLWQKWNIAKQCVIEKLIYVPKNWFSLYIMMVLIPTDELYEYINSLLVYLKKNYSTCSSKFAPQAGWQSYYLFFWVNFICWFTRAVFEFKR